MDMYLVWADIRRAGFGCGSCTVPGVRRSVVLLISLLRLVDVACRPVAVATAADCPSLIPRPVFIFWVMAPCSLVAGLQTFGAPLILKLQYESTRLHSVSAVWCSFDTRIVFK